MTDFKNVPIKDIRPDPNQPRKFYDDVAMQELTTSVKEKGILQPILIRPNGKGYLLVCGERRYRAATSAGLADLPAVIRELTDDEALELQIIENLQRKDVHPMEEAVAFKSLLDKGKDLHDVAARVGKSDFYVRRRVKLASLTKQWQDLYYQNGISHKDAIDLSQFNDADQAMVYKEVVRKSGKEINVGNVEWQIRNLTGSLDDAPFDKKDPTLNPEMGVCGSCPFNTAVSSLFPDDAKSPKCKKIDCYNHKSTVQFAHVLQLVMDDPTIVMISDNYSGSSDKLVTALAKTHKVYFSKDYDRAHKKYATLQELESNKVAGATKAFFIEGHEKGKYAWIKFSRETSAGGKTKSVAAKEKIASGKATAADIDAEISRINERESRSKEIDQEKLWAQIKPLIDLEDKADLFKKVPFTSSKLTQEEKNAIAVALIQETDLNEKEIAIKITGIKTDWYRLNAKSVKKFAITDAQLFHLLRIFMISTCKKQGISADDSTGPSVLMPVLRSPAYIPDQIKTIEEEAAAKIAKRQENVKKRLVELASQKKELAPKKAAPKNPSQRRNRKNSSLTF